MPASAPVWLLVTSMAAILARLGAAAACLSTSRRVVGPRAKVSWRFLATGLGLWSMASGYRLASELLAGAPAGAPTLAEWLRLAAAIALAASIARYPTQPPDRFGRIRSLLDISILVLAILGMAWLVFLRPVFEVGLSGPAMLFWESLRLASDLIVLALLVRLVLLARRRSEVAGFQALTLALLIQTGTDLLAGYRQILPIPANPGAGPSTAEVVVSILIVYAAARVGRREEVARAPEIETRPIGPPLEALLAVAMTYLVVGFTGVDYWLRGDVDRAGLIVSILLCLLLVARQGVIAGQVEMRQFAALVNGSADLAFIAQGDGKIVLSNSAWSRALQADDSPGGPRNMKDFVVEDLAGRGDLALAARTGWSGEVRLRRRDGSEFPVSLSLQPVRDERRPGPLLAGTAYDLTEVNAREARLRQALEEVARARQELEGMNTALESKVEQRTRQLAHTVEDLERLNQELKELDRLKTEFLALVSHELRSPLTNIHSGLELLLSHPEGIPSPLRKSLDLIQEETVRLARFVEATLDLSSLQAGRFQLASAPISLIEVAEEARRRFPDHAGASRLALQIPSDLPLVRADARAVGSVLYHLMDNGLKYGGAGEVRVEARAEGEGVQIWVTDSGPGIPEAERERVFEMFHRLDASDSRQVYGHGLGLPLARQFIEAMGGRIQAQAAPAEGTRIVIWLPRAASAEPAAVPQESVS